MSRILLWCCTGLLLLWPAAANAQTRLAWQFKENDRFFAEWNFFKLERSRQGTQLGEGVEELQIISRFTVLKAEPEHLVLEQQFGVVNSRSVGQANFRSINLFKGAVLQLTLGKDFKVERIEGIEPLLGVMQGNAGVPQKAALIGMENQVRLWLQYLFVPLPENEVKVGSSWHTKTSLEGVVYALDKTYAYRGPVPTVLGTLHQVDVRAEAELRPDVMQKEHLQDMTITVADHQGTMYVDPRAGRLVQGKVHSRLCFEGMVQPLPGAPLTSLSFETDLFATVSVTKENPLEASPLPALQLVSAQKGSSDLPKEVVASTGMKLVQIPAGKFTMGAKSFGQQEPDEPFQVTISQPFYMGEHEVTIGDYRQFVRDTGYKTEAERRHGCIGFDPERKKLVPGPRYSWKNPGWDVNDRHPAVNLSWEDAKEFCAWLSEKEGKNYRLPTEAEWEYACRAGTRTAYSSGDEPETLAKAGNVVDLSAKELFPQWQAHRAKDGYVFTAPVGSFAPNAFGLYDMHGNALEWCEDWFFPYPRNGAQRDPQGAPLGLTRVQRGGSFADFPQQCTSAHRMGFPAAACCISSGFRVVLADGPAIPYTRPDTWTGLPVLPCDADILKVYAKNTSKEIFRPVQDAAAMVNSEHFGLLRVALNGRETVLLKKQVLPVKQAIRFYTEQLQETELPHLHLIRATGYLAMGNKKAALADLGEAIQLDDQNPWLYIRRGGLLQFDHHFEAAIKDYEKAIELKDENPWTHNALAWLLATCPEEEIRDGKRALKHAQLARQLRRVRDGNILDTLAAACAENGQFDDAIRWENAALEDIPFAAQFGEMARQRLKLYEAKTPLRLP